MEEQYKKWNEDSNKPANDFVYYTMDVHRLKVFMHRALGIFWPKREEGDKCMMRSFIIYTFMKEIRNLQNVLVWKSEENRSVGIP